MGWVLVLLTPFFCYLFRFTDIGFYWVIFTCSFVYNICFMYYFIFDSKQGFDLLGVPYNAYSKKISCKLLELVYKIKYVVK